MIALSALGQKLKRDLAKLAEEEEIQVLTYKKDRGFTVRFFGDNQYEISEHGYQNQVLSGLSREAANKALKSIIRREFPRSNNCHYSIRKEIK